MTLCAITVVVPTFNSAKLLRRCLSALQDCEFGSGHYDVVVVDDGSTDDTEAVCAAFASHGNLRYVFQENRGAAAARNKGMSLARSDYIAFTDADCVPSERWLQEAYDALAQGAGLVGGTTTNSDSLVFPWRIAPVGHFGITANLAFDTQRLPRLFFDEQLGGILGEDTDFVARAAVRGEVIVHRESMVIVHPVNELTMSGVLKRAKWRANEVVIAKRWGRSSYSAMHPIFRPQILGHISPITPVLAVGMGVVTGLARRDRRLLGLVSILGVGLVIGTPAMEKLVTNRQPGFRLTHRQRGRTALTAVAYSAAVIYWRGRRSAAERYLVL